MCPATGWILLTAFPPLFPHCSFTQLYSHSLITMFFFLFVLPPVPVPASPRVNAQTKPYHVTRLAVMSDFSPTPWCTTPTPTPTRTPPDPIRPPYPRLLLRIPLNTRSRAAVESAIATKVTNHYEKKANKKKRYFKKKSNDVLRVMSCSLTILSVRACVLSSPSPLPSLSPRLSTPCSQQYV